MNTKFLLILVILSQSSAFYGQTIKKSLTDKQIEMRHLDIKKIQDIYKELVLNKENINFQDQATIESSDTHDVKAYIDPSSKYIHYIEKYADRTIYIFGNTNAGYNTEDRIEKKGTIVVEKADFYGNGILKALGNVEYYGDQKERAIGTWYQYDKNGNLIEEKEYKYEDELYEFSLEDVYSYINDRYLSYTDSSTVDQKKKLQDIRSGKNLNYYEVTDIMKSPRVTTNGKITNEPFWIVSIWETPINSYRIIHIDGKTGKVLHERTNVPTKC